MVIIKMQDLQVGVQKMGPYLHEILHTKITILNKDSNMLKVKE